MDAKINKNKIGILVSMTIVFFFFFFSCIFSDDVDMFMIIPFISLFWFVFVTIIMVGIIRRRMQAHMNQDETMVTDDEKQIDLEREKLELEKAKLLLEREQLEMKKQNIAQNKMVTCEYCGLSNSAGNTRCRGCGSKLH